MAYSDYGAFVYRNGERRPDKEDVGVFDTDEANLPSGLRIWANIIKNQEREDDAWWRHSQHGVMGDGQVRCACYKQCFPTVYVWRDGEDEPHAFTDEEIIAHNGWSDEPWVNTWEHDGKVSTYIDAWECDETIEFTVPGLEGYTFTHNGYGKPRGSAMREPDGTLWTCGHDYWYGAGFENEY